MNYQDINKINTQIRTDISFKIGLLWNCFYKTSVNHSRPIYDQILKSIYYKTLSHNRDIGNVIMNYKKLSM